MSNHTFVYIDLFVLILLLTKKKIVVMFVSQIEFFPHCAKNREKNLCKIYENPDLRSKEIPRNGSNIWNLWLLCFRK